MREAVRNREVDGRRVVGVVFLVREPARLVDVVDGQQVHVVLPPSVVLPDVPSANVQADPCRIALGGVVPDLGLEYEAPGHVLLAKQLHQALGAVFPEAEGVAAKFGG